MKKLLCILPLAALLLLWSCDGNNGKNDPDQPGLITLQQGCYASGDTAYVLLFPEGQHRGQYISLAYYADSMMIAMQPQLLTGYNDTTGMAMFIADDAIVTLRNNGKDTIWIITTEETMTFVRKAEVDYAPKNLAGTWRMSFEINAYMSFKLWDAMIDNDLHCNVEFNIPDSATLAMWLEMSGAMAELPEGSEEMIEGLPWSEMLAAIPSGLEGDIWYSAYAGMGVFVPELQNYTENYGLFFSTPTGSTIRITYGSMNFDMTRIK